MGCGDPDRTQSEPGSQKSRSENKHAVRRPKRRPLAGIHSKGKGGRRLIREKGLIGYGRGLDLILRVTGNHCRQS